MDEQEKEVLNDMQGEAEAYDAPPVENDAIEEIIGKIREAVKRGNVAKLLISRAGHVYVDLPLNVGIVGGLIGLAAAPWALIAGAIAAAGFDCTVELVRADGEIVDLSPRTIGKKAVDAGNTVVDEFKNMVRPADAPAEEPAPDEQVPFDEKPDDQ